MSMKCTRCGSGNVIETLELCLRCAEPTGRLTKVEPSPCCDPPYALTKRDQYGTLAEAMTLEAMAHELRRSSSFSTLFGTMTRESIEQWLKKWDEHHPLTKTYEEVTREVLARVGVSFLKAGEELPLWKINPTPPVLRDSVVVDGAWRKFSKEWDEVVQAMEKPENATVIPYDSVWVESLEISEPEYVGEMTVRPLFDETWKPGESNPTAEQKQVKEDGIFGQADRLRALGLERSA
jgi:hypothetical protein